MDIPHVMEGDTRRRTSCRGIRILRIIRLVRAALPLLLAGLPFGLFMTVVGGGELFTGNTAMVTAAAIEGKASTGGLLKNWVFSYMGNFIGCVSLFLLYSGSVSSPSVSCYPHVLASILLLGHEIIDVPNAPIIIHSAWR